MDKELFEKLEEYLRAYEVLTALVAQGGISPEYSSKLKDQLKREIDDLLSKVLIEEQPPEAPEVEKKEE